MFFANMLPPYSMRIVKGDKKGQSEGFEKPLLCILPYKKGRQDEVR